MHLQHYVGFSLALLCSVPAFSQHGIQQKRVSRVSLQVRPVQEKLKSKCLGWFPLRDSEADARYVQLDPKANEKLSVQFSVLFQTNPVDCKLSFDSDKVVKIGERTHSSGKIIHDFSLTFQPPAIAVMATSNGVQEELIFDAPLEANSDKGFFEFFSRSTIYFENRYMILTTNNPDTDIQSIHLLPVFGGKISTPFPYLRSWYAGYSLFQNLGSLIPSKGTDVAYSEFLFEVNYQKTLSRLGVLLGLGAEARGRNVYQISETRPFVIGQVLRPGFSAQLNWFPSFYMQNRRSKHRFGVMMDYHNLSLISLGGDSVKQQLVDVSLQYRVSRRSPLVWGLGYSKFIQSALIPDISDEPIRENTSNFYLRLSLFPIPEKGAL